MAARKKLFVAQLSDDRELSDHIGRTAARYGVETSGVAWKEEPGKPIWGEVASMIMKGGCDGLLLAGKRDEWLADAETRAHISLAAFKASILMGPSFALFAMLDAFPETWPTPFAGVATVERDKLGPRLAAKLGMRKSVPALDYRLDVHPLPVGDGMVVELGPPEGKEWRGALLAIRGGGDISHHTVGPKGAPPDRGVVEYAMKGLKLELSGEEFTGWAVHNRLDSDSSYYVRVAGTPLGLAFGELPGGDAGELFAMGLA